MYSHLHLLKFVYYCKRFAQKHKIKGVAGFHDAPFMRIENVRRVPSRVESMFDPVEKMYAAVAGWTAVRCFYPLAQILSLRAMMCHATPFWQE